MSKRMSVASSSSSYTSGDSAFGETEPRASESPTPSPSPNPETVRATLDTYVAAARVGRAAYASGDLVGAVQQFDQALALELQTELDCLYDTSIGMMSGLVRTEVDKRIQSSPRRVPLDGSCGKVMQSLLRTFSEAEEKVRLKPTDPKLYLRMGAALCCTNEWDKAKRIYLDGLNACKDRKDLKAALKMLLRMEEITSGREIPREPYAVCSGDGVRTRKDSKARTLPSSFRSSRTKSASLDLDSLDLSTSYVEGDNRRGDAEPAKKHSKPRRMSSFGRRRAKKIPLAQLEERQAWSDVFREGFNPGQVHLKPSAITQMRRLSFDFLSHSSSGTEEDEEERRSSSCQLQSFVAINFQSMRIESDDSELEDD